MDTSTNAMKSMRLYDRVERLLKELEAAGFAADRRSRWMIWHLLTICIIAARRPSIGPSATAA